MLYKQHKHIGDCILVGDTLPIPGFPDATGRIVFSQKEEIQYTSPEFIEELKRYNESLSRLSIKAIWQAIEKDNIAATVQRTFGDINAWAGDHAKLFPPDGKKVCFDDLNVRLQVVANTHDFEYLALALGNWDHFMPMSYRMWEIFHDEALRLAENFSGQAIADSPFQTGMASDGVTPELIFDLDTGDLAKALFLEAYGCHFLEDSFVSGHIRTPRLLFGKDMDSLRSKVMHDKDNELRLSGQNKNGKRFALIGEDAKLDDFSNATTLSKDNDLKIFTDIVKNAVTSSVRQVIETAFGAYKADDIDSGEVGVHVPQVSIAWEKLSVDRSRTHALNIQPVGLDIHKYKPLYKLHANYAKNKGVFEDLCLFKNDNNGTWRRVRLSDVDNFYAEKELTWWLPKTPEDPITVP